MIYAIIGGIIVLIILICVIVVLVYKNKYNFLYIKVKEADNNLDILLQKKKKFCLKLYLF